MNQDKVSLLLNENERNYSTKYNDLPTQRNHEEPQKEGVAGSKMPQSKVSHEDTKAQILDVFERDGELEVYGTSVSLRLCVRNNKGTTDKISFLPMAVEPDAKDGYIRRVHTWDS